MSNKKFPKTSKVLVEEALKMVSPSIRLMDSVAKAFKQHKKNEDTKATAVKARYGKAVMKKRGGTFKGTF